MREERSAEDILRSPHSPRLGVSRAVRVGDRVMVSGTAPIWPDGGVDADPRAQARRCLEIIQAVLSTVGADLDSVIRTGIYLSDPRWADAVDHAHDEVFGEFCPATTVVVVAGLVDPRWKVMIDAEAILCS